jgi:hypothetical protein
MVQPSRTIATTASVDHAPVRQAKQKRVPGDTFAPVPAHGFPPARQFAPVFKHALTRRERPHRKHTLPVDRRPPYDHSPHTVSLTDIGASIRVQIYRCIIL